MNYVGSRPRKNESAHRFQEAEEEQLEKLTAETEEVQVTLDMVNSILLDKGFRRGDIKEIPEATMPKEVVLPKQEPEPPKVVVQYTSETSKSVAQHMPEQENVIP